MTFHSCFLCLYIAEDLANSYFLEQIPLLHTPPGRWPNLSLFTPTGTEMLKGPLCHGYLKRRRGFKYPLGTLSLIYVIMEVSLLVLVRVCTVSLEMKWQL